MSASWARAARRLARAILSRIRFAAIRCLTPESLDWARSKAFTAASSCAYRVFSCASAARACARLEAIESAPAVAGVPSATTSATSETAASTEASRRRGRCMGRLDMARDITTREHPQTQALL